MSIKTSQLCRFCQKEVKLAYYCEECGISCCSECLYDEKIDYYICQDCNSKNIEYFDSGGRKVCKDCEGENINKVTQHLKSCPKCHSSKILNIYEKKEELEQKFLELIKETRTYIKPVREVINELYILRHKIKVARDPPLRCYHYPQMEKELLTLFKQIIYIKDNLLEKINNHFRHIALNKEYFFDIYNQPNSNIRIIESILDNLCRNHDSIDKFIQDNAKEIYEKFGFFQKNLRFIEKINKLFLPYKRFLNLAEDEKPVYAVKTKLINGLDSQNKFKKSKGILFITNFDLSFVHEYGLVKRKQELIFKAPVNDLINISDKGKLFKKLFLQFEYGKYEFSLPSNFISKVIDYIVLARKFQEKDIYDEQSAQEVQNIDIDLNDIIKYIEEGINSFFSIKCQFNTRASIKENEDTEKTQNVQSNNPYYPELNNNYNYLNYQNNRTPNYWEQKMLYHQPIFHSPDNPYFRGDNIFPTNYINPLYQGYDNYNYLRNPTIFDIDKNNLYSQNVYNSSRYQNYRPFQYSDPNSYNPYLRPYYFHNPSDFDERNILMKQLEKAQKFSQQVPTSLNLENEYLFKDFSNLHNSNPNIYLNEFYKTPSFQNNQKNNFTEFFDPNDPSLRNPNFIASDLHERNKNYYKKLNDLKRERYGLKETLKELEEKFENGILSEVDYFRTFKNLQKDIYTIEKKIEYLKDKIKDQEILTRNFHKKKI